MLEARVAAPKTENVEPARATARVLMELPRERKSRQESEELRRTREKTDKVDPPRVVVRNERLEPSWTNSKQLRVEDNRRKLRILVELPKLEWSKTDSAERERMPAQIDVAEFRRT